jgi:1-acyl-sn-glycerol-3-phosphate acyltransferase
MICHAVLAEVLLRFVFPRVSTASRRALIGWWSRKVLEILNIEPRVSGAAPQRGEEAAMVASNHVSWLDICLISSVRPTRFIAKSEIRAWPLVGWIAQQSGTIFIRRDQMRDMARINDVVHEAMVDGDCIGLFPEGITTEGDVLLKFHSSLFEPAVSNSAHVHPLALRYERPDGTLCREISFFGERTFKESLTLIIGEPRVIARMDFAEPVDCEGMHRRDVARLTHERVASLLGVATVGIAPRSVADRQVVHS